MIALELEVKTSVQCTGVTGLLLKRVVERNEGFCLLATVQTEKTETG